jgi:hypothetical protein
MIKILPYSTIDLTSQEVDKILSIFNSLQNISNVRFKMDFAFPFNEFSLFEHYQNYSVGPVIEIQHNHNLLYVAFTKVSYRMNSGSKFPTQPIEEYQAWYVFTLNKQYGHILIRNETLFDKIHEFIRPVEIDFKEDSEFGKRFYVLATDELIAKNLLNSQFRSGLKQLYSKDLRIEILNDKMIIGNGKHIDASTTLEVVNFFYSLVTKNDNF